MAAFWWRIICRLTALVTLALFAAEPDVEVWVFADGDWLRRIRLAPWCRAKPMAWVMGRGGREF
jgi:hypothetical protein